MIEVLLPSSVAVEAVRGFDPDARLLPEEVEYMRNAVLRRQREYATGRSCARRALARLGHDTAAIPSGEKREPRWPPDVVGSITHCDGYCAAAVALRRDLWTLGIDAEPHAPLPSGVLDLISVPSERKWLAGAPPATHWDRVLFSAKEAVYKAYFPLVRTWLDFHQAELAFEPGQGRFLARITGEPAVVNGRALTVMHGRFAVMDGFVLTAIALGA